MRSPIRSNFGSGKAYGLALAGHYASPLLRLYARGSVHGSPTPPESWRRGIIFGSTHIGDLLYSTSSFAALKKRFPGCDWYCIAEPYALEILTGNPYLSGIIPVKNEKDLLQGDSRGMAQIKALKADAALIMRRQHYWRLLYAAVKAGIPNRVGYGDKGLDAWLTRSVAPCLGKKPFAAYYRHLIADLCNYPPDWSLRPQIFRSSEAETKAQGFLRSVGIGEKDKLIVVFATARTLRIGWPDAHYREFLRMAPVEFGAKVVLAGTKADAPRLTALAHDLPGRIEVAAGQLGLLELACVLARSTFVLGPDSGPRHIANAVGAPMFFVPNLLTDECEAGNYCESETNLIPGCSFLSPQAAVQKAAELRPEHVINIIKVYFEARRSIETQIPSLRIQ